MPRWLEALSRTTLLFWEDRNPLSWAEISVLLFSTAGAYVVGRSAFAGGSEVFDMAALVPLLHVAIATVLLLTGERLGKIEVWAPNLARLLILHLAISMVVLVPAAAIEFVETLSEWQIASVASLFSTVLLGTYTLRVNRSPGAVLKRGALYASATGITGASALLLRYVILPF